MKIYPPSLVMREFRFKLQMIHHFPLTIQSVSKDVENQNLTHAVENGNQHKHTGGHYAKFVKFKICTFLHYPDIQLLIIYPRETFALVYEEAFIKLVFALLFLLAIKLETT